MGLYITLRIHQIDADTQLDVDAANAAIMAEDYGGLGELYEESQHEPGWEGPLKVENGDLLLAQRYEGDDFCGYGRETQCWSCYAGDSFQNIANNMRQGKIVFFVEIEGNDNEFYIVEPGKVTQKSAASLTF